MPEMSVRPMTEAEFDAWQDVPAAAYADEQVQVGKGTADEVLGRVRVGLDHPRGTAGCAFLYDIELEAPHRGQGYGRALLAAAEEAARVHGRTALDLDVFGGNAAAISLYERAGHLVVQQQMRRALDR